MAAAGTRHGGNKPLWGWRCPLRPGQRWRAVARQMHDEGMTLAEVGAVLGVSKQRVHQVLVPVAEAAVSPAEGQAKGRWMRGIFIRKPGESPTSWLKRLRAVDTLPLNEAERLLLYRAVQQAEQELKQEREDAAAPAPPEKEAPVGRRKGKGTPKKKGKSKGD